MSGVLLMVLLLSAGGVYLADKEAWGEVECQFGGSTVIPEDRLIARSETYDLATFDVPEVFVSASFRSVYHHNALRWPPNPTHAGEVALHGGYPQVLRNPRTNEVDFPFQWFATRVNDANNERISLHEQALRWSQHRSLSHMGQMRIVYPLAVIDRLRRSGQCRAVNVSKAELEGAFADELALLQPSPGYMRLW